MLAVEITDLTKDYFVGFWRKRRRRALDHLHLEVEQGEVFGLLGPNGAGKTTTLKILLRLVFPTSGSARLLGRPLDDVQLHRRIGYLPENPYFYDHLTAEEFLSYAGKLCGLSGTDLSRRVNTLLDRVGLAQSHNEPLRKFSKGMIQRVGIAQALVNDPELIFLDEPMSGLDPLGRRDVRNLVLQLKEEGKTVFFSTHILPDAETLCDRVAVLNGGRLHGSGELRALLRQEASGTEIVLEGPSAEVMQAIGPFCSSAVQTGARVRVIVPANGDVEQCLSAAIRLHAKLISLNPVGMSLEDYFMAQVAGGQPSAGKPGEGSPVLPREGS
jgi:ABC-2 type transport system ATP-binding protein